MLKHLGDMRNEEILISVLKMRVLVCVVHLWQTWVVKQNFFGGGGKKGTPCKETTQ